MSNHERHPCEVQSPHLQRREHLTLFLAIDQAVVVLHGDERREVVGDGVVCKAVNTMGGYGTSASVDILCI